MIQCYYKIKVRHREVKKMELYDIKEYVEAVLNNYFNSKEFAEITNGYQVWGTEDGWEVIDKDGDKIDISIIIS